jgi:two-component system response regulator AlgR
VFIVDDEAPARARLKALLADIATEVPNGSSARRPTASRRCALLESEPVDVALVDIRMPRMDGIELARHLAKLAHPPALVFTTAYDQYAVQAFELNAVDYLLKPVRRSAWPRRWPRRAAPGPPSPERWRRLAPGARATSRSSSAAASCWCRWPTCSTSRPS